MKKKLMNRNLAAKPGMELAKRIMKAGEEANKNKPRKKLVPIGDVCTCKEYEEIMVCNKPCANFGA